MVKKSGCKKNEIYIKGLGCRPKKKIRQINNIIIFYDDVYKFGCRSPTGIMEDRLTYKKAVEWAKQTKDWVKR
jgi:hypothetical protein